MSSRAQIGSSNQMLTYLILSKNISIDVYLILCMWVIGGVTILTALFLLTFLVVISIIMESLTKYEKFV
jgi:hypothetical protein